MRAPGGWLLNVSRFAASTRAADGLQPVGGGRPAVAGQRTWRPARNWGNKRPLMPSAFVRGLPLCLRSPGRQPVVVNHRLSFLVSRAVPCVPCSVGVGSITHRLGHGRDRLGVQRYCQYVSSCAALVTHPTWWPGKNDESTAELFVLIAWSRCRPDRDWAPLPVVEAGPQRQ